MWRKSAEFSETDADEKSEVFKHRGTLVSDLLLSMQDLVIEADIDGVWKPIVKGLSLDLHKGEIVGLIGESGAGKSTFGLAAMGYTKPGCRIVSGSIKLEGEELVGAPLRRLRQIRGNSVSYVAQSAAASFNPAHKLIEQFAEAPVQHGKMQQAQAERRGTELYRALDLDRKSTRLNSSHSSVSRMPSSA